MTGIQTEFDELERPLDDGVDRAFTVSEDYVFHGEQIERETKILLLEDGGVHLSQRVPEQGIFDSLTLNAAVVRKLAHDLEDA